MISKKQAKLIANLITDLTMASDAVTRQCTKDRPDGKVLTFWMNDHDSTMLKLREVLGVKIKDTYAELREQLSVAAEAEEVSIQCLPSR